MSNDYNGISVSQIRLMVERGEQRVRWMREDIRRYEKLNHQCSHLELIREKNEELTYTVAYVATWVRILSTLDRGTKEEVL